MRWCICDKCLQTGMNCAGVKCTCRFTERETEEDRRKKYEPCILSDEYLWSILLYLVQYDITLDGTGRYNDTHGYNSVFHIVFCRGAQLLNRR